MGLDGWILAVQAWQLEFHLRTHRKAEEHRLHRVDLCTSHAGYGTCVPTSASSYKYILAKYKIIEIAWIS